MSRAPVICAVLVLLLTCLVYKTDVRTTIVQTASKTSSIIAAPFTNNASHNYNPDYDPTTSNHKTGDSKGPGHKLAPGVILNQSKREVTASDASHSLRLEDDGNIALYRTFGRSNNNIDTRLLWSLGTGSNEKKPQHVLRLSEDGVLEAVAQFKRDGHIQEQMLWHSNLIPECKTPATPASPAKPPSLRLTSEGEVHIEGRCKVFAPPPSNSAGKLALLVSGLYRTNALVCKTHIQFLAKHPAAESVDIFAYMLYEPHDIHDDVTVESIEAGIRECYAPYLRTLTLKLADNVTEPFTGESPPQCAAHKNGEHLNRLQSQLKTLYLGGMEWWNWAAKQGVKHDTVLRVRTDHEFFGSSLPKLKSAAELKGNELVIPPIMARDERAFWHWTCGNPFGGVDAGKCNQTPCRWKHI